MEKQRLRKRRIVVIGSGLGVVSFCQSFQSKFAEITLISEEFNFAPDAVLQTIATGKIDAEKFTKSLRVMFSKRKDMRLVTGRVASINTEERKLQLEGESEPVEYDFLLIGKEATSTSKDTFSLSTYNETLRLSKVLQSTAMKSIAVIGNGPQAIELAVRFTSNAEKVHFFNSDIDSFPEAEETPLKRINYALRRTGVHLFPDTKIERWKDNVVCIGDQTIPCDMLVNTHDAIIPQSIINHGYEHKDQRLLTTRPDSTLPGNDRIFAFGELREGLDGLGKPIPNTDIAIIQHAKHLAKTLKGKIEMWRGYNIDSPSFVFRSKGSFCRIQSIQSIGLLRKRYLFGVKATFIDTFWHKWPPFVVTYGRFSSLWKLLKWSIAAR